MIAHYEYFWGHFSLMVKNLDKKWFASPNHDHQIYYIIYIILLINIYTQFGAGVY